MKRWPVVADSDFPIRTVAKRVSSLEPVGKGRTRWLVEAAETSQPTVWEAC